MFRCQVSGFYHGFRRFGFSPYVRYPVTVDKAKETGALLIAASIIAAIRLRGEPVKLSPKLTCVVADSVQLARLVLREVEKG